jgi:hypothetical protein
VEKTVMVRAGDIAAGIKGDCSRCPVALALRRSFPSAGDVMVCFTINLYRTVKDGLPSARVKTPDDVVCFIRDFDYGRRVKPFSFKLDLPIDTFRGATPGAPAPSDPVESE